MIIKKFKDMVAGWFIGDFEPTALKTKAFEVCYKLHKKGESWDRHYHKKATEINMLISGKIKTQNTLLIPGDIFIINSGEISDPKFLEDCALIIVKIPSIVGDKYKI